MRRGCGTRDCWRSWRVLGALLVARMNTPEGLTLAGQRALAVLVLCVIWWVFTPVGLPVTSIGLALPPLMGALPAAEAFALFGNQAVFFVIGVFLVAAVLMETGLSSRMCLVGLRRFAKNEDRLCNGVLFISWALCALIVSHAVAAFMLPIARAQPRPRWPPGQQSGCCSRWPGAPWPGPT